MTLTILGVFLAVFYVCLICFPRTRCFLNSHAYNFERQKVVFNHPSGDITEIHNKYICINCGKSRIEKQYLVQK